MITLNITVTGTDAVIADETLKITTGLKGARCVFEFDSAWDNLQKTAVFRCGRIEKDVIIVTDTSGDIPLNVCDIPFELLNNNGNKLYIGVYGTTADGLAAIPTVYAKTQTVLEGAEPSGSDPSEPLPPTWITLEAQCAEAAAEANAAADNANAAANAIREAADNGEFDGPQGPPGEPKIVDQSYDPSSDNPQSGKAVYQAINQIVVEELADAMSEQQIWGAASPSAVVDYVLSKLKPERKWHKTTITVADDETTAVLLEDIPCYGVAIKSAIPKATASASLMLEGLTENNTTKVSISGSSYINANNDTTYGAMFIELRNGIWQYKRTIYVASDTNKSTTVYDASIADMFVSEDDFPRIEKVRVRGYGVNIPNGSIIDVWRLY